MYIEFLILAHCASESGALVSAPKYSESRNLIRVNADKPERRAQVFLGSKRRAPGPDHGDDPNDEQHPDLPNGGPDGKHYGDGYPSQDPYDDTVRNSRKPYPAPPNPY